MTATIVITCPECKKQMKGPAELQGKQIRCKNCGKTFTVRATPAARGPSQPRPPQAKTAPQQPPKSATQKTPAKPPPVDEAEDSNPYALMDDDAALEAITKPKAPPAPKPKAASDDEDANPYGITDLELAPRCPHCAKELESAEAVICLHCGYNTQTRTMGTTKRMVQTTGADRFRWLLPGIICVLVMLGLIGFDLWFIFGLQSTWDAMDDMMPHSFSMGVRIWVLIMSLGGLYFAGRAAFNRLVLHPSPPEIEKK